MKRMVIAGMVTESSYKTTNLEKVRLYRLDTKAIKDVSLGELAPVAEALGIMNFNDVSILNVRKKYPLYLKSAVTRIYSGADACFVVGTFGDGGYVCMRPHVACDYLRVIPRSRLVSDVKKGKLTLLNALVVQGIPYDTVEPITGVWDDVSYLKGRELVEGAESDCEHAPVNQSGTDSAGSDDVVTHDELNMLNESQREFLKDYYIKYSIEAFNRIVGKAKWTLKEEHEIVEKNAKRRASKLERLTELKTLSGGSFWRFAGLWDVGHVSNKDEHKCEFGHKLRYIYRACPVDKTIWDAKEAGTLLQFGIVCHADFLNIPADEVSRLGRLQAVMQDEIRFISTVVANNSLSKHDELMQSLHSVLGRLEKNGKLAMFLDERLINAYKGFVQNHLPLVESFVLDTLSKLNEHTPYEILTAIGIPATWYIQDITPLYSLSNNAGDTSKKGYSSKVRYEHSVGIDAVYRASERYDKALTRYADYLMKGDLAGEYMYNPLACITEFTKNKSGEYQRYGRDEIVLDKEPEKRKYLYGYNGETRSLRETWLRYFGGHTFEQTALLAPDGNEVFCLTLVGLERAIKLVESLTKTGENLLRQLGEKNINTIIDKMYYAYRMKNHEGVHPQLLQAVFAAVPGSMYGLRLKNMLANKPKLRENLLSLCEAVKYGTDEDYINLIRSVFQLNVDLPEAMDTSTAAPIAPSTATAAPIAPSTATAAPIAPSTATAAPIAPSTSTAAPSTSTAAPSTSTAAPSTATAAPSTAIAAPSTHSYRQNEDESKKKADEFMQIYAKLPAELTNNSTEIQIAVDIIKRFRTQLKEKEGFTKRENWRVDKELETLRQLQKESR